MSYSVAELRGIDGEALEIGQRKDMMKRVFPFQ